MKFLVTLLLFVFACSSQALDAQQLQNATAADILQLAAQELPTCAVRRVARSSDHQGLLSIAHMHNNDP